MRSKMNDAASDVLTARSVGNVWTAKYIVYISIGGYKMLIVKSNFYVIGTLRSNLSSEELTFIKVG